MEALDLCPLAIRHHHRVSLPLRPADHRRGVLRRGFPDRVGAHRQVKYLQLTKFFGKLFLINFAMGVVTGIVQEFQFGMNWSSLQPFRR